MGFKILFSVLGLFFILIGSLYILNFLQKTPEAEKTQQEYSFNFIPQKTRVVNITEDSTDEPISIKATTLPKFVVSLIAEKFKNIWEVDAAERGSIIDTSVTNLKGDTKLSVTSEFDETQKQMIITPHTANKVKPGLYTLNVKVKTYTGEDVTITQDFMWGVLAINTNKGIYTTGETVEIGMAVLGDLGRTKCIATDTVSLNTAKIWLTITSPSGKIQKLSTDDKTIHGSGDCKDRSVTNKADFLTEVKADEPGTYQITMEAEHYLGKRSINSSFQVTSTPPPYVIERTAFPTRIYPKVDYPVIVSVKANTNYNGPIHDILPKNFIISNISNAGKVGSTDKFQAITWNTSLEKGKTYTFSYTIHFPPVAPEFYLIGPFTIGKFNEGREWKIASDSIFQLVQEVNDNGSGGSVSATFPSDPTQKNLVIAICSRTTSSSFSTPSGFTLAYNNSTSSPRVYMFYRIAPAGMSPTVTCSGSSGNKGIQLLEFSGNSTSSVRDRRGRRNATSCSTGAHTSVTTSITPANPDELVVAAFAATGTTLVNGHSSYTDSSSSFNGPTGTFDSSWSEVINNPPIATSDTATFAASGGTCANVIVSFNPTVTVSQGSYQFFENKDAVNPDIVFGGTATENLPITLNQPNYPFRLRILLDVDSPSGTIIDVDSGDWMLQYAPLPESGDCADGTYNPVDTQANGTPIAYNPNPNSGGNNAIIGSTPDDPIDSAYTTRLEDYAETWLSDGSEDIVNHNLTMGNNQAGLFDFSLIDNTDDSASTTYCLKVANGDGSPLDAYRNYPKVTTIPLDVNVRSGSNIVGGTNIQ